MRITRHTARDVDRDVYLHGLRACFPGWGGVERFDWCFARSIAGREPDLFLLHDGEEPVAGMGVTYRMLRRVDGTATRVGIMTGAWTLESARGRGAFTRIMDASREVSPEILAFVRAENTTRRRLEAAGAIAIPSFYCRRARALPPLPERAARFVYSPGEWRSQFVERPFPTERLEGPGWTAIIEHGVDSDQVLSVDGDREQALRALLARGRDMFVFTIGEPVSDDATPGYVMAFGISESVWHLENGDRM